MREELQKRDGIRGTFTATFERFGKKTAYKGPPIVTLLFVNVADVNGAIVTEHLWFKMCKAWEALRLDPGDKVEFCARVRPYTKGYRGRREDYDTPPVTIDYRLSHPTNCRRIPPKSEQVIPMTYGEQLSLFT